MRRQISFLLILLVGIFIWTTLIVLTHSSTAIISWDEGFHGGTAFFISESLRHKFAFQDYTYILNDFKNGIIWYLPLWSITAGILGAIFSPSVEVYRLTTLLFSSLSIILLAFFSRSLLDTKSGLITAVTLATAPIFIVYSHLMMIEVPLLFSTSLALIAFYIYLSISKLTKLNFIFLLGAFVIGVTTKITAIAIIYGVIIVYGALLKLFFRNSPSTKRFYSPGTLYFLIVGLFTFNLFRFFTKNFLQADLLEFHLTQSNQLTGFSTNFLMTLFKNIGQNLLFYFNDFSHMPILSFFWFSSLIAYILLKRSLLSYYLLVWTVVIYLIFSAVKPQAVQYILPIFAPLSIAAGLFWGEFINYRNRLVKIPSFIFLLISISLLGLFYLDKTETIGWRNIETNQTTAALFVANNAKFGDRVITTGDGTRFLISIYSKDKKLQTINGAASNCDKFLQDSVEWAILDNGPQSPIRLTTLQNNNWLKIREYLGSIENTSILKNKNDTKHITIIDEDFIAKRCFRLLALGDNEININAVFDKKPSLTTNKDIKISLKLNPIKGLQDFYILRDDIDKNLKKAQKFTFHYPQLKQNKPIYILFDIPADVEMKINSVEINSP